VIFDVTGLPDASKVKVVARIRYPQSPGGFHNTFAYKHSDGRVLYFATIGQSKALIYDLAKVVSGAPESTWLVGDVPNPTPFKQIGGGGYHDFYVGYDVATHQDKFYGAALGGYSVWDVTNPSATKQLFTITSLARSREGELCWSMYPECGRIVDTTTARRASSHDEPTPTGRSIARFCRRERISRCRDECASDGTAHHWRGAR
jgi:hypothetical protein